MSANEKVPPGFKLQLSLRGHTDLVSQIAWLPSSKTLVSASHDGTVRLWDLTNRKSRILEGHTDKVNAVALTPNEQQVVSASSDGTLKVWSLKNGAEILTLSSSYYNKPSIYSVVVTSDGQQVISGSDEISIWDLKNRTLLHNIQFPQAANQFNTIAVTTDDRYIAAGSYDDGETLLTSPKDYFSPTSSEPTSSLKTIVVRNLDINDDNGVFDLRGHTQGISSVRVMPNGQILASASEDCTIRLWDLRTGRQIRVIEGHTASVTDISFSAKGKFLASRSNDGSIRLWRCDTWVQVGILYEPTFPENKLSRVAFHPKIPILATLGEADKIIRIWSLDFDVFLGVAPATSSVYYVNAKAVLVGESGVGKSGLGIRMAEQEFRPTASTHGAQFWQISVSKQLKLVSKSIPVRAELTLWDLAGQPDYHLVHQLFLDDTDVALLLFDCSDATAPFRGVPYWAKVLRKQAPANALKYLVSARCDVSPVTVDRREINQVLGEYGLDGYFRTCAKTGEGVGELLQHILDSVPWDKLSRTTTPKVFQIIREFLLERKEAGDTLISLELVKREIKQRYTESTPSPAEIDTAVGLLQVRGFVYRLAPTPNFDIVLLRPELINKYASSIIQAARKHPEGIGAILEREVVCANLPFDGFELGERLLPSDEKLVLESTVELFIRHTLAFREIGRLIFPSQLNILHRIPVDEHPPTEVTYEFSGSVEAIYASLVVCLSYTQDFQRENLWKYAAEFSREGYHLGFAMQQVAEGTGELEIYFYPGVSDFDRVTFIRFIKNHLYTKGIDLQERIRLYCPECREEVKNRKAIEKRVQAGKLEIPCQYCDTAVLIPRSIEEKYRSDRAYLEKQKELQATVEKRTQQEVKAFRQDHQQYMADSDNCIRILHLSDIHLGTVEQANRYFSQLATDLTQNLNIKQLNYLVISGDIANRSTEEEYDAAFFLVDKLVKRYGLDPNRVVIVPGNHDLNWDLSEAAYPFVAKRKLPNPLPEGRYIEAGGAGALICDEAEYKQRFAYFSDRFYKKVYGKPYPLEYDQQAILHPCPQDKILFLALNSCWEIDHHYRTRAGIHANAIANAVDQILSDNYDDWLKIAVWHHPVNGSESMKNPAFLEQLAVHGFQLGIHGHIHEAKDENFQYDTKRGLRIIAAGTFGAPTHEQVTGIPLQYNLLTLDPETGELTVETRKKEKVDGAWSADARWGDKNNPIPRYPIQLRYGSEKKKIDSAANPPQAVTEENSSNPQQSIFSDVQVGGSMTVGSIYQYYGSGTAPQRPQPTQTPPPKRTILFLASSPINEARLRLDVEMREIDNGLRLAQQRDRFVIEQRWAVRTDDLRRALLDLNPEIVHFCGHGAGAGGLVLEDNTGQAKLASTEALAKLFKLFTNRVRCVVLNACYSEVQADAIRQHIDYVVGMSDAVSDTAAIKFAVGFYDALVRERSYEDAFDFGCNAIEFENVPEELTPVLKKKPS